MDNQTTDNEPLQPEPAMPVITAKPQADMAKRKRSANRICGIALGLLIFVVLSFTGSILYNSLSGTKTLTDLFSSDLIILSVYAYQASWALVIFARIKYKESRFAKILLGVNIVSAVAFCFTLIALIAFGGYRCGSIYVGV